MRTIATPLFVLAASVGCVNSFEGSILQFDFSPAFPVLASPGVAPKAGEVAANEHFTLYALDSDDTSGRLFELAQFEIHRVVDLASPCYIDAGEHVPHPGLHVSKFAEVIGQDTGITDLANPPAGATEAQKIDAATAVQRMINVNALAGAMGVKVVSSASTSNYPPVAANCTDPAGIPPPSCTDEDSNKRRLAMCQQAWRDDPLYYEGTDRVLTAPLNGLTYGVVDGANPISGGPIGGAQITIDEVLDNFAAFAVYQQPDGQSAPGGTMVLYGKPLLPQATRGVMHVHMTHPTVSSITAEVAIFSNLGRDDVTF